MGTKNKDLDHIFINKSLFFPKHGILVIGDLHIGYEEALRQSGILVPESQISEVMEELKDIISRIKKQKQALKKIIFLGDIKHFFPFEKHEKKYFNALLEFLKQYLPENRIIFIKGNHDTMDYSFEKKLLRDYYIENCIAFIHGHKSFPEIFAKNIKTIVMGHIHPSIILSDSQSIKRERYKCFLTGEYKHKEIIILPSFLSMVEGTPINNYPEDYENNFSIIPRKELISFKVQVIGDSAVYDFGKIKNKI